MQGVLVCAEHEELLLAAHEQAQQAREVATTRTIDVHKTHSTYARALTDL